MTTQDLFSPQAQLSAKRGAPSAESANSALRASRSALDGALPAEFAALVDRALDGEPDSRSAESAHSALRASRSALDGALSAEFADEEESTEEAEDESSSDPQPEAGLASAVCLGDALAPNILLLPPPVSAELRSAERGARSAEWEVGSAEREASTLRSNATPVLRSSPATEDGEDGRSAESGDSAFRAPRSALEQADDSAPDNIRVIDFRQPAEAKIIRLPLAAGFSAEREARSAEWEVGSAPSGDSALRAPRSALLEDDAATAQLPGDEGSTEDFAHWPASGGPGEGLPGNSKGVAKAIAHGGLPRVYGAADSAAEATGISAARQEGRMDSLKNSGQGNAFAGRGQEGPEEFPPAAHESSSAELRSTDFSARVSGAMDWQLGRPVGSLDRPSPAPLSPEQSATVDRISNLISRETSLVRQYSSDSMAVVLRPDDGTELYVHFAQRNGQIEATIRCDRGDVQQLGALWPQLQESLAQQRVRLAPLQEGPSNFNHSTGFGSSGEGGGSQRHSPSDRQSMDERSAPASSIPDVLHGRGRGGSRRRLTTSRPGWETWA